MRDVTASEVKQTIEKEKDAVVIDVLSGESYRAKHVPGSISVPSDEPRFVERVAQNVPDKATPVVVYCSGPTCDASPQAAEELEQAGYEDVREFRGGLEGWRSAGYEFDRGP